MATELSSNLKRKTRNTSSSETASPDGKRICEASDSSDSHFTAESNMSEVIAQQLQQILDRLTSVEGKLDGVLQKVQHLETALNGVQSEIKALQTKTTKIKEATDEMDAGLTNLNTEVQELQRKIYDNQKEIKAANDRCLYQEVYNRRENLRLLGIPESMDIEKTPAKSVYRFFEMELEIENARDIEFQRVHRIGKKKVGVHRPIIVRFLRFPDRERVFKKALELKEDIEV